ncbi:DUF305 domain-containing protein (plasmid) [Paroceanicella profunda]|uniref:DUF305 domain-containing protein n=1 Tax=Paroceanicella profunda TaxID=2579971 RepID=A0A5B8G4Y3_9RHOB|nr:DUF305 domain-containing protein [Paroceanicella profunda]QDL94342.1 DUF305 domain-containing protein [Paroceanicella profunda]
MPHPLTRSARAPGTPDQGRRALFGGALLAGAALALSRLPAAAHDGKMHAAPGADPAALAAEQPFLSRNAEAMDRMMADMAVAPTGDVDADFVAMMVPHHQGAIDMAKLQLRYGRNQNLRNIAQEIIITQQQEIRAMHYALKTAATPAHD